MLAFNLKTLYINLRFLPWKQAIKFPIMISHSVKLKLSKSSEILIKCDRVDFGMIRIGFGEVDIFHDRRSILAIEGKVIFRGRTYIGYGSKVSVATTGVLDLGNNFKISTSSSIVCHRSIVIGDLVLISWDVLIMDTDLHKIMDMDGKRVNQDHAISVHRETWIGARSMILKGAVIGEGCVVAAGSTVTKNLGNITHSVLKSSKVIRTGVHWRE